MTVFTGQAQGIRRWWLVLVAAALLTGACADTEPGSGKGDDDDLSEEEGSAVVDDEQDDEEEDEQDDEEEDEQEDEKKPDGGAKLDAGAARDGSADAKSPPATRDADVADEDVDASDDASDAGLASDASQPEREDLGKGDGRDVITIGDSWMLFIFTGIQESLVRASGNQPYRRYARPGTRLLDGVIPGQYAAAKREDPDIKTVVMTGGGNDIIQNAALQADCEEGGAMCQAQSDKIRAALSDLWKQMSEDGVQDVIHVMYSSSAGSSIKNREENNMRTAEACAAVPPPLRCHLLNTDALIGPSDIRGDGIHPTDPGYDKIGQAVYELMEEKGMRR